MKDFITFIREQGVVGLAIGFVLGGAVSGLVKEFVNDIINPLLGVLLGSISGLEGASVTILGATILWGSFVAALVNFLVIALVVYYGFKVLGLEKLDKKKA